MDSVELVDDIESLLVELRCGECWLGSITVVLHEKDMVLALENGEVRDGFWCAVSRVCGEGCVTPMAGPLILAWSDVERDGSSRSFEKWH